MSITSKLTAACIAIALLFGGVWRAYVAIDQGGFDRAESKYKAAIAEQRGAAGRLLAEETARVATSEKALADFKHSQELRDEKNKTTVSDLGRRLTALAGPAGRLRDPNGTVCRCGGSRPPGEASADDGDRKGDGAADGGLLSEELSGLLLSEAKKADVINLAYTSCRAQALTDREQLR